MKRVLSGLLTIGLVAGVAVLGSLAGRAVWENVTAEDAPKAVAPPVDVLEEEAASDKFEGEILGVYIGPLGAEVPGKYITYEEICGSQPSEQVSWDKAGEFDISLELPTPFALNRDSLNTGVIACGDTVYAARWDYAATQPSGYPGSLIIVRSVFKDFGFDASSRRVRDTEIGGLPAVYISPLSENGIGSGAGVIFPGDTIATSIHSSGVPEADLLRVAELLAAEIARGD